MYGEPVAGSRNAVYPVKRMKFQVKHKPNYFSSFTSSSSSSEEVSI